MDQMIPVTHVRNAVQWSGAAALITPEPWTQDALCAQTDPDSFFPEKGEATKPARDVCTSCDVVAECLAYALRTKQRYGVWGGKSERQRRRMLKLPEAEVVILGRDGLTVDQRRDAVREGHGRGWADGQIATHIGCTIRTVQRIRAELDLETQWGAA